MSILDKLSTRTASKYPLIQVVIGPRQVGKTTAARALIESFRGAKIFASADSPTPHSAQWLETHWLRAREQAQPTLLVIDEVQKVTGWSEIVKLLFDQDRNRRDLRVVLLGSASLNIQSGLRESLAGRFELIRAHHWNFQESQQEFDWNLEQYLKFGGYPAAARYIEDTERWQSYIKDSIIEPVIGRDILGMVSITKPSLFRQTFEIAMHYPAQTLSYQKIVGQLQERGSTETVKHYLEILESAFLLRQVFKFSTRPLSTRESSPKLVPLAPALVHAFSSPKRIDVDNDWRGHIFESVVGAALAQATDKLFTWRERNLEVDYVMNIDGKIYAIEVKSGRRTRRSGLDAFLNSFPAATPIIVTPENCGPILTSDPLAGVEALRQ